MLDSIVAAHVPYHLDDVRSGLTNKPAVVQILQQTFQLKLRHTTIGPRLTHLDLFWSHGTNVAGAVGKQVLFELTRNRLLIRHIDVRCLAHQTVDHLLPLLWLGSRRHKVALLHASSSARASGSVAAPCSTESATRLHP